MTRTNIQPPSAQRELSSAQFEALRDLIYRECGILYSQARSATLAVRVQRRLRARGLDSVASYLERLQAGGLPGELEQLVEEATTNETYFFRAERHWKYFTEKVLADAAGRAKPGGKFKIWSAAASNGSEAYSAAILALEKLPPAAPKPYILATDINSRVLQAAAEGLYGEKDLSRTPDSIKKKYFNREGEKARLKPGVRTLVVFRRHNLMAPAPEGGFQVVFLRNVLIYFDRAAKERAFKHVFDAMLPGGTLFLGESESTVGVEHPFKYIEPSIYQKPL